MNFDLNSTQKYQTLSQNPSNTSLHNVKINTATCTVGTMTHNKASNKTRLLKSELKTCAKTLQTSICISYDLLTEVHRMDEQVVVLKCDKDRLMGK